MLLDQVAASREALRHRLGERATPDVERAWFRAIEVRLAEWRAGSATWAEQRRNRLRDVLPLLGVTPGSDAQLDDLFGSAGATPYVGAEHEVDVLGARAAGLRAVLLDRDGTAPDDERCVVPSLADLPRLAASDRMGP